MAALAEWVAVAGIAHSRELGPYHVYQRGASSSAQSYAELYPVLQNPVLQTGFCSEPRIPGSPRHTFARCA